MKRYISLSLKCNIEFRCLDRLYLAIKFLRYRAKLWFFNVILPSNHLPVASMSVSPRSVAFGLFVLVPSSYDKMIEDVQNENHTMYSLTGALNCYLGIHQ